MDHIGLQTLKDELLADAGEAEKAVALAHERFSLAGPAGMEAAAFQLVRFYNIIEQIALRVAKAFENHIDDDRGWHAELMRRVSIEIRGVRPALFPAKLGAPLRQLRGFRHVVTHAYDLTLEPERLSLVIRDADVVGATLRGACEDFMAEVMRRAGMD